MGPPVSPPLPQRRVWLDVAVLFVMLGAGASRLSATSLDVQLNSDLRSLESRIDDWTTDTSIQAPALHFPGIDDDLVDVGEYPSATGARRFAAVDDELVRAYKNSSGARVQLYIGYYRHQAQAKELAGDASSAAAANRRNRNKGRNC